jgi:hypothetical protein
MQGDLSLLREMYFFVAGLEESGFHPVLTECLEIDISPIRDASCLREFCPRLLNRLACVIRALPSEAVDESLMTLLCEYHRASFLRLSSDTAYEVHYTSLSYQALFRGPGH